MPEDITPLTTWHVQFDNPNFLGWSVVAAYLCAAILCGRMALKTDNVISGESRIWWLLSVVLLFLGINKQLNLQTLLIVMGRRAAFAGGWYGRRRLVQAVFSAVFALLGICCFALFAVRARRFMLRNRLAFAGIIVLLLFVVLRASTINHANDLFGLNLKDEHWAWVLEIAGSLLIMGSTAPRPATQS